MLGNKPILLVEDDPAYTENIKCALDIMGIKSRLIHWDNGKDALIYLRNQNNRMPWLILLGMNAHSLDGLDFMEVVKSDDRLRIVPVVIISGSDKNQDILRAYELGIAGYVVKPRDASKIVDTITTIMNYWTLSELPPIER
ncbi:MAG: response regulator [Sedimentisphaerales bacterium]|nr:response regulator [Sedimentisphaerales bacterium]